MSHPAADRSGHAVGRARSAQPPAADRRLRAAAGVRPSRSCSASSISRCRWRWRCWRWALAAARAVGQVEAARALFVPISFLVYFAHTFGWGTMGLLCFSAEAVRQHDRGLTAGGWQVLRAAYHSLAMALPAIADAAVAERGDGRHDARLVRLGLSSGNICCACSATAGGLRPCLAAVVMLAVPLFALVHPRLTLSRNLAFSGLVLAPDLCASAADRVRFGLCRHAAGALRRRDVRPGDPLQGGDPLPAGARWLAVARSRFMLVRLAGTTASMAIAWTRQAEHSSGARPAAARCRGWRSWSGTAARNGRCGGLTILAHSPPCGAMPSPTTIGRWPGRAC